VFHEVEFLQPEGIVETRVRKSFHRYGLPEKVLERVARVAVPWPVDEPAAHHCEADAKPVRVGRAEEAEETDDGSALGESCSREVFFVELHTYHEVDVIGSVVEAFEVCDDSGVRGEVLEAFADWDGDVVAWE